MPNYSYQCRDCDNLWVELRHSEERDNPATCNQCQSTNTLRGFDTPNLVLKEAFLDGHKRPGWDKLREAARLNTEAATAKKDTKKEIEKEIRKLGVRMNGRKS